MSALRIVPAVCVSLGLLAAAEPTPRNKPAMAFDSHRNRLVVFGGLYEAPQTNPPRRAAPVRNDTWEWSGSSWEQVSASGPPGRCVAAMVYDSRRKKVVLFGGQDVQGEQLGDTWEWDGTRWEQRAIEGPSPSPRSVFDMVYDSRRGRVVLLGGQQGRGKPFLNDTWTWDGRTWSEIRSPGPSPRLLHAMAYDEKRDLVVLFGGAHPPERAAMADTWLFNGREWREARAHTGSRGSERRSVKTARLLRSG
ncbi:MAG: kelch repeat-containing protein [Bryobacteraceae bacterium]|nr:kelch repeat-containing protein [Bryobacteraceae bacterium]